MKKQDESLSAILYRLRDDLIRIENDHAFDHHVPSRMFGAIAHAEQQIRTWANAGGERVRTR